MLLSLLSCLCGAVLGLRFDVLILIPATLAAWLTVGFVSWMAEAPIIQALLHLAAVSLALQLGYLVGTLSRRTLLAARVRRQRGWSKSAVAVSERL